MYGTFRVDLDECEGFDREYFLTTRSWDSQLSRMCDGEDVNDSPHRRRPDVFIINGRSAPRTVHPEDGSPPLVSQGDTVRLHLVNAGRFISHPMHVHNHRFQVVGKDGSKAPEAARYDADITNLAPAERHAVEFGAGAGPGIYLVHCHKVNHATNGLDEAASYTGGMITGLVYESAVDTDIFGDLLDCAGDDG